jgi:hypothetical protein
MQRKKQDNASNTQISENSAISSSKASLAMKWLGSLMFIQLFTKIMHFGLNLVIVGYLSPESYGIAALQLPFVGMAITRLLKEALHRTAVRENDPQGNNPWEIIIQFLRD